MERKGEGAGTHPAGARRLGQRWSGCRGTGAQDRVGVLVLARVWKERRLARALALGRGMVGRSGWRVERC